MVVNSPLAWLALALVAAVVSAAPDKTIIKGALMDWSFGVNGNLNPAEWNAPAFLHVDMIDVCAGMRFNRHWGAGLGTSVFSGDIISTVSYFPVSGYVFYDLNPDARWRRSMAYGSVTFVYDGRDSWSGTEYPPFVVVAAGIGYTFYAVNPHFEVGYNSHRQAFTFAVGLGIPGGTYVLR
jgi:hypothetical protein